MSLQSQTASFSGGKRERRRRKRGLEEGERSREGGSEWVMKGRGRKSERRLSGGGDSKGRGWEMGRMQGEWRKGEYWGVSGGAKRGGEGSGGQEGGGGRRVGVGGDGVRGRGSGVGGLGRRDGERGEERGMGRSRG